MSFVIWKHRGRANPSLSGKFPLSMQKQKLAAFSGSREQFQPFASTSLDVFIADGFGRKKSVHEERRKVIFGKDTCTLVVCIEWMALGAQARCNPSPNKPATTLYLICCITHYPSVVTSSEYY